MRDYLVRHIWLSFTLSKVLGAVLLAALSFSLAREKQYEASMGAAGVAVAVATMSFDAKQNNDDETGNPYLKKIRELELKNVQLHEQIQAGERIHKLEVELAVLKNQKTLQSLPESEKANAILKLIESSSSTVMAPNTQFTGGLATGSTENISIQPTDNNPLEPKQEDEYD